MYVRYDVNLIWLRLRWERHSSVICMYQVDVSTWGGAASVEEHACRLSENGTDKKRTYAQAKGPKHNCKIHSPDSAIFCGKCILAVSLGRIVAHVALLALPEMPTYWLCLEHKSIVAGNF